MISNEMTEHARYSCVSVIGLFETRPVMGILNRMWKIQGWEAHLTPGYPDLASKEKVDPDIEYSSRKLENRRRVGPQMIDHVARKVNVSSALIMFCIRAMAFVWSVFRYG